MAIAVDHKTDVEGFDLQAAASDIAAGRTVVFEGVDVVRSVIHGQEVFFATDMIRDPIQRNHRSGNFYEARELRQLKSAFPLGGVFVDIGANVGNHSLFVARFLSPASVIAIEPNPRAARLLLANVYLNGLSAVVDTQHLGKGLGRSGQAGYGIEDRKKNLGAARMLPGAGDIEVVTGDSILNGVEPSFIKIDVEGMEMDVLHGLAATLEKHRPPLLVEVDDDNETEFQKWAANAGYRVARTFQRYKTNRNHFMRAVREEPKQ